MKLEWKKQEKEIYGAAAAPCAIDVPPQKYIVVPGAGNPNHEIFSEKVAALFSVAYKIKMTYRTFAEKDQEIDDYSVYPLEGIWSRASEKEDLSRCLSSGDTRAQRLYYRRERSVCESAPFKTDRQTDLVKENLQYIIMIRQPDFITEEMFHNALEAVKQKKPAIYTADISFETIHDGKCVQILHKGAFDDEPASFEVMDRYCSEQGYRRIGKEHREIYLNNASRTEKSRLKTILRYRVADATLRRGLPTSL